MFDTGKFLLSFDTDYNCTLVENIGLNAKYSMSSYLFQNTIRVYQFLRNGGGGMKKLGVIEFFHEKKWGHKNNQVMIGGVTKLLNILVIAVAIFQKFPCLEVTILFKILIFSNKRNTQY